MELHEKHTHHAPRDQIFSDTQVDRWGQPILIRGLGFRGPNIYGPEQGRHDPAELYHRLHIESPTGEVWHAEPVRNPRTLDELLRLRDRAFPTGTVVAWTGHWQDLRRVDDPEWGTGYRDKGVRRTYPPKSATVADPKCRVVSKGKAKRRSHKIRRAV